MKYFGVVLSHNSVNSEWVQRELQIALARELTERKVVILPILLEPVEIPHFLRDKIFADFTTSEKSSEAFPRLIKALGIVEKQVSELQAEAAPEKQKTIRQLPLVNKDTSASRRLAQFDDIRIIGMDDNKSHKPDPSKALYNIYLEMSDTPTEEWQAIFEAKRRFPRHANWRNAWIDGQYLVIYCAPDELSTYHQNDLKADVKGSNEEYRNYLADLARKETVESGKQQAEQTSLSNLKKQLKFD
jgi:hypothetical protein